MHFNRSIMMYKTVNEMLLKLAYIYSGKMEIGPPNCSQSNRTLDQKINTMKHKNKLLNVNSLN